MFAESVNSNKMYRSRSALIYPRQSWKHRLGRRPFRGNRILSGFVSRRLSRVGAVEQAETPPTRQTHLRARKGEQTFFGRAGFTTARKFKNVRASGERARILVQSDSYQRQTDLVASDAGHTTGGPTIEKTTSKTDRIQRTDMYVHIYMCRSTV